MRERDISCRAKGRRQARETKIKDADLQRQREAIYERDEELKI